MNHNSTGRPVLKGLLAKEIIRIEGNSNYSKIFFADKRYPITVSCVLKKLQQSLPGHMFIRPHRTHLVNKYFVQSVCINGSKSSILLHNGESIAVSRRKRAMILQTAV